MSRVHRVLCGPFFGFCHDPVEPSFPEIHTHTHTHTQVLSSALINLPLFAKQAGETARMDQLPSSVRLYLCRETPSNIEEEFFCFCRAEHFVKGQKPRRNPASKTRLQSDEVFSRRRSEGRVRSGLTRHAQAPSCQQVGSAVAYAGAGASTRSGPLDPFGKLRTRGNCLHQ
jgi:hypothetical protein